MQFLTEQFFSVLVFFYQATGNLGLAIIAFTVVSRLLLVTLSLPSLRARDQILKLQPELKKLKNKFGTNKQALQKAQLELYQKYNVNPLSGCLPQLVQVGLLFFLQHAFTTFFNTNSSIDPTFLWVNLAQPDTTYALPIITGVTQLILSLMIAPGAEVRDVVPNQAKNKKIKQENKKEEDVAEMAATMQKQMIFFMPIMMAFIALRLPSGLSLYWSIATVVSIIQQFVISGPGGLKTYTQRLLGVLQRK